MPLRESRLGLNQIQFGRDMQRVLKVGGAHPVGVRQSEKNAEHFRLLAVGQRHDLVVRLHRRHRLEVQRRATRGTAVDDAGDGVLMFGAHHHHIPATAVGDDLVLEIFRGVAPPGKSLERGSQLRPMTPQCVTNIAQCRARIVGDVARRRDRAARAGSFVGKRCGRRHEVAQQGGRWAQATNRLAGIVHGIHEGRETDQRQRIERLSRDGQRVQNVEQRFGRLDGERPAVCQESHGLRGRVESCSNLSSVRRWFEGERRGASQGRQRLERQRFPNAIELERAEESGLHGQVPRTPGEPAIIARTRGLSPPRSDGLGNDLRRLQQLHVE